MRAHAPGGGEKRGTCDHSVVEVVTDGVRFLADSVANELSRQGRRIPVVIHPQVAGGEGMTRPGAREGSRSLRLAGHIRSVAKSDARPACSMPVCVPLTLR